MRLNNSDGEAKTTVLYNTQYLRNIASYSAISRRLFLLIRRYRENRDANVAVNL